MIKIQQAIAKLESTQLKVDEIDEAIAILRSIASRPAPFSQIARTFKNNTYQGGGGDYYAYREGFIAAEVYYGIRNKQA